MSRRSRTGLSPWSTAVLLGTMIVLIFGAFAALARAAWVEDIQRASLTASNLAALIAQEIGRNVGAYDLSIQGARDAALNPAIMQAPKDLRNTALFDRAATAAYLGEITVLDRNGDTVASSRDAPGPFGNQSDRDYFRIHALRPDFGLYLSRPLVSHVSGEEIMAMSRRIPAPDGSFGGVVVGTLRLEYFRQLFRQMKLGRNGSVTLFRNDDTVMMREPFDPRLIGLRGAGQETLDRASHAPDGEYQATSRVDGTDRLFHYRRIGSLPLVISVGLAVSDIHAAWWRRSALVGGLVTTCGACIVLLTLRLGRELRWRIEAEAALLTLVDTDGLTGLANRRCFDRVLAAEWQRAAEQGRPLSLLMIDADHFKAYNDSFGHGAGDEILRRIGGCLAQPPHRTGAIAARYGGEEFAVILPGLGASAVLDVAEAARRAIGDLDIAHPGSPFGRVTASIGCASAEPAGAATSGALLAAADAALYRSKRSGRNKVSWQDAVPEDLRLAS